MKAYNLTETPYPVSPYLQDAYHKPIPSAPREPNPMFSLDLIISRGLTLGQLAEGAFPSQQYDATKPQEWLNSVAAKAENLTYHELNATLVWFYPTREQSAIYWLCGLPGVLCDETARELDGLGIPYWSPRGYHGQPLAVQS